MKSCLRVAIPERWPEGSAEASWVLLGEEARVLRQGRGPIDTWPQADACELVCLGPQVVWTTVDIPPARGKDRERLWRFAIEDAVLGTGSQHLTVTHIEPLAEGERLGVLVVAEARLRQIRDLVQGAGHRLSGVYAEVQTAPAGDDGVHLSVGEHGAIWRANTRQGWALEVDTLHAAWQATGAAGQPIKGTLHLAHVSAAEGRPAERADDWPAWHRASPYQWWQGDWRQASNLLHGTWAPMVPTAQGWQAYRWPVGLLLASLLLWGLATVSEVLWWRYREFSLQRQADQVFQQVLPGVAAVSPSTQIWRALGEERARHGRLHPDDALALIDRVSGVLDPGALASLSYQEGALTVQLGADAAENVAGVQAALRHAGLRVEETVEAGAVRLTVRSKEVAP